ncbi:MAG: LicD family protein [Peptoniphilaceae bacterium]|uniref:LicD family protein n=1 Tax=Parvimonas sp. TaxID=1944660 RepID=UPI002A75DE45|nr:LicD family protein [Parvimonas sp.]MDD7764372.1 LicD family protein [Peptoniphilaceae bacterium]MDY3050042.1 LicD family protein [Parvimonas sp.]
MEKKYLSMEEIKNKELEILKYIDNFCKKNSIKYFINYGTLLGAIRHKGFIPWDDDIDLMMSRKDYEKFIKLFEKDESIYKVIHLGNDKKYFNNFLKVYDSSTVIEDNRNYKTYDVGIFVDIFPYDNFNDLKAVNKTYFWESLKLLSFSKKENIQYGDSKLKDFIRYFFWLIFKNISPVYFANKSEKLIKKYSTEKGKFYGVLSSKFKEKEVFNENVFEKLITLEFEGIQLPAPKEYDKILTQYYENYMQLPPVEKQCYPHEIKAFVKERNN